MNRGTVLVYILAFTYIFITWGWFAFWLAFFIVISYHSYSYYAAYGYWPWIAAWSIISSSRLSHKNDNISESRPKVTFVDVAGIDEAQEELQEIVDFLKHKERYSAAGARIPRGAIMIGPSGVGKTLSAKAVAGEADVAFIEIAGSSFVNKYVGG